MSTLVTPAVVRSAPRFQYWREVRLVFWSLVALGLVAITLSPWASGFADDATRQGTDLQLYAAEVEHLRDGSNYYDIAARELTTRGFPTKSVFNWRTPLPFTLIAAVPEFAARGVLALRDLVEEDLAEEDFEERDLAAPLRRSPAPFSSRVETLLVCSAVRVGVP